MKRQLPQWMLGGGLPSNPQHNTGDSSSRTTSSDKHIEDQSAVEKEPKEPKRRRSPSRNNSLEKDIEDENVEKKEPKEPKKRKQSSRYSSLDNDIDCGGIKESKQRKGSSKNKSDLEKATIKNEEPVDSLQGKPPRYHHLVKCKEQKRTKENVSSYDETSKNSRKVVDVAFTKDEDDVIDLTMEDLMIIANEYIQEDNNSKQVESSSKIQHMSVKNQSRDITDSHSSCGDVPTTTERIHRSDSNVVDSTTTINNGNKFDLENPTQSMLDVFLGPWLKKTQEEKEKKKKSDHLEFELEAYEQRNLLVEEEKPVTTTTTFAKKKSSLKDMVNMFLD